MTKGNYNAGLYRSYEKAGPDFLAYKLEKIFTKIETPEDIALHNDMLSDVLELTKGDHVTLLKGIANALLRKTPKQDRFLFKVAKQIINIGRNKI